MNVNVKMVAEALKELSDSHLQWRLWVRDSEGLMSSFTEAVCSLFDDSGLADAIDRKVKPIFNEKIDKELVKLSEQAQRAGTVFHELEADQIIRHPLMLSISKLSNEILVQIRNET